MNLEKLFEMQKVLDDHIMNEHPKLKGQNNLDWKVLALLVEIGECANEWRGFKKWSKNQNPTKILHTTAGATPENAVYFKCMSEDDCGEYSSKEDFVSLLGEPDYEICPKCHEGYTYPFREKNPLLEEYVDGLHFILSIGLEYGYKPIYVRPYKYDNITRQFKELYWEISDLDKSSKRDDYLAVFSKFVGLGEMLGFTWEKIEEAYFAKNQINHQRQESGY